MNKFLAGILATTMILEMGAVPVAMAYEEYIGSEDVSVISEYVVGGNCGIAEFDFANVTWSLDRSTGVLTISGIGDMRSFSSSATAPWSGYRNEIFEVLIEGNVISIGNSAFSSCVNLEQVTMSDTVRTIEGGAFFGCSNLKSVKLSENLTTIGSATFSNCISLKSITLPESLNIMGGYTFLDCSSLEEVTLPSNLTTLESRTFENCTALKTVKIPDTVRSIGAGAFSGCQLLYTIVLPSKLESLGSNAFSNCESLTSIIIPDTLNSIDTRTFDGCRSLTSVFIPTSVTYLGQNSFDTRNTLDVYYGGSQSQWEAIAQEVSVFSSNADTTVHYNYKLPAQDDSFSDILGDLNISDANIPSGHYGVWVMNQNKEVVPNVNIKLNGIDYTTDAKGFVSAPESFEAVTCTLSLDGYYDRGNISVPNTLNGGTNIVTIYSDDQKIHTTSVQAVANGEELDLLNSSSYVKEFDKDSNFVATTYSITVDTVSQEGIARYQLLQGDTEIASSSSNTLTVPAYNVTASSIFQKETTFLSLDKVSANEPMSIKVTDKDGNTVTTLLGLKVAEYDNAIAPASEKDWSFKVGNGFSITIPDNVYLFGGYEVDLNLPLLPMEAEVFADGTVKVAVNSSTLTSADRDKAWEKLEKDFDKAYSNYVTYETISGFGGLIADEVEVGPVKPKISVVGYGEGVLDKDGKLKMSLKIVLSGSAKGGAHQNLIVCAVPVYWAFDASGKLALTGVGTVEMLNGVMDFDLNATLAPSVSATLEGGIGWNDFASVGVAGTAELNTSYNFGTQRATAKALFSADVVGEAYFIFDLNKELGKREWTLYDSAISKSAEAIELTMDDMPNVLSELSPLMDSSNYKLSDRDYLNGVASINLEDTDTLKSNLFYDPMAKLVSVNGTSYAFWIDDAGERTAENRTALFYAYQNKDGSWSDPTTILEETATSTNDFNFSLAVVGNTVHIVWVKNESILTEGTSFDDTILDFEIYYTSLNTSNHNISTVEQLSNNDAAASYPSISQDGTLLAWVETTADSKDGIFAFDNSNVICYAKVSDLLNVQKITVDQKITSLAVTNGSIAYIADTDNDFTTAVDREILVFDVDSNKTTSLLGNGMNTALSFHNDVLYWQSQGNLYYSEDGKTIETVLTDESLYSINDTYKVMGDQEKLSIVWQKLTASATDPEELSTAIYAVHLENDSWSPSYLLRETESEISYPVSGYVTGSETVLLWQDWVEGTMSLKTTHTEKPVDVSLVRAEIDNTVSAGQQAEITLILQNIGAETVEKVEILMDNTVFTTITSANLKVGESKEFTVKYTVPNDLKSAKDVTLSVKAEGETTLKDNEFPMTIGVSDLSLTVERSFMNGTELATISVTNENGIPSDATLEVRSHSADGDLIHSKEFNAVTQGETSAYLLNLTALESQEEERIDSFYVRITSDTQDASFSSTEELIYLGYGRETIEVTSNTLFFQTNGGTSISSQTIEEGKTATKPTNPTKSGYSFVGWYSDSALTKTFDFSTIITANTTIYAKWEENENQNPEDPSATYTVSFQTNGGTSISSQTIEEGKTATKPTNPTKSGYSFVGWYSDSSLTTVFDFATIITANTTIYAKWEENENQNTEDPSATFTFSFQTNGGTSISSQTVEEGKTATKPSNPTKSGYSFVEWYSDSSLTTVFDFATIITGNTTIYAKWAVIEAEFTPYTVTFDGNGGEIDVETMKTGSDFTLSSLPTPTLEGYIFDGWFTTKTGSTQVTTDYEFTKDRTIYAQWSKPTYTVKFDAKGGIDKAVYLTTDEDGYIDEFPIPTHETLFFDGWYLTQNGGPEAVTEDTVFTENTFLYARWKDATSHFGTYKNMIIAQNTRGGNYGGTVNTDNNNPMEGETVILNVNPTYRYSLLSISAVNSRGTTVSLKKISDDQYSFVQPADDLEITAIFEFN